ncbi:hypothetical protein TNIN_27641 [Trichonephila inaurata madagascariensis]|uniref:Uncharacterized protein n=1 Tax=Trichonephila inaurata madagascariensis TaxID=2747483 RepID=A0A8X6YD96_9ARAC|nr:hypothetical protein TNIN_27641 [Trichonephila inaurata madagascariensis]
MQPLYAANSRNFHSTGGAEGLKPLSLRANRENLLEDAFCIATFFHAFPSETTLEEKKLFLKRPEKNPRSRPGVCSPVHRQPLARLF